MADTGAPEQESRSFELPTEEPPAAAAVEDATAPPAEDGSSSDDDGGKKLTDATTLPAKAGGKWNQLLSTIHPVVRRHADTVANHPYVTGTASSLRQRAGQAQERMQPIVNHPYVQKGRQASTDKRVLRFLLVTVGLLGLGLLVRVLLQKYPEFGGDLKMKLLKKKEEL